MSVSRVGTETFSVNDQSTSASSQNDTHTTTAGTTLLTCYVGLEGNEAMTAGSPTYNAASLTLIHDTGSTGANQDTRSYLFGIVGVEDVTDGDTIVNWDFSAGPVISYWINWAGTVLSSVGAATNYLSEVTETGSSNTAVHASAGSAGNALVGFGHAQSAIMQPVSNGDGFTEIVDDQTGADTADFGYWAAELLDSAPSGLTITYGSSDEHSSIFIEIVAASTGFLPGYHAAGRGVMRGVGRGVG